MIFEIHGNTLGNVSDSWSPKEIRLENLIITTADSEAPVLHPSIFGEPLLFISNQVRTRHNKRADILALDVSGNGVIVELKRDTGFLGVETQALQYLADFSKLTGMAFINQFGGDDTESLQNQIMSHCVSGFDIDKTNVRSRIILLARDFDYTLYSMGEWLAIHDVGFRCITYTPVKIGEREFLSFSTTFNHASDTQYPLSFRSTTREPGYFWHNIGQADEDWWQYLVDAERISASFENRPLDDGEKLLKGYVPGDTIIAYAKGYGAVGWGIVGSPLQYRLVKPGEKEDKLGGYQLHRLTVKWKYSAMRLGDGIAPDVVRQQFNIYHPLRTSVGIERGRARILIDALNERRD